MFNDNFKLYACESKGHNLENDAVEIMKIIQNELEKRNYKALILGLVKDTNQIDRLKINFD